MYESVQSVVFIKGKTIKRIPNKLKRREGIQGWLSVVPLLLLILSIRAYPMIVGIIKSFTNWDGLYRNDFIGLTNYRNALMSGQFWTLLRNNVVIMINLPIQLLLGIIVSLLLYEGIKGWKFFRFCYYLPQVISTLVIGYIFKMLFAYRGGFNELLGIIGVSNNAIDWLGKGSTALMVIIICIVWFDIGWQGVLMMGGMTAISPTIFEAARIDGAGYWTRLFKITMPLLVRTIEYSCVISVLWCFTGLFNVIYSLTRGGPGYETTTIDFMIYVKAFSGGSELGYASAIAVLLMLIVAIFTIVQMKIANKLDRGVE